MIFGIGTDIIEIQRIEKAAHLDGFLKKIFTENEINFFKHKKSESIAGNFAAKEAFSKALGSGFRGFSPIDIEVLREKNGKPEIILHDNAKKIADDFGIKNIFISISHCKDYAMATVILEA